MPRVDFCRRNLDQYGRKALDRLERHYPDVQVGLWGCLDKCTFCREHAFARVNRQNLVSAPDGESLWTALDAVMADITLHSP